MNDLEYGICFQSSIVFVAFLEKNSFRLILFTLVQTKHTLNKTPILLTDIAKGLHVLTYLARRDYASLILQLTYMSPKMS